MGTESPMNDKVRGIILKQSDYRDSSVLLTVLTREYGRISLIAQGARKPTSKNARSLMPYTETEFNFDYKENKTIFRMRSVSTVAFYRRLYEDLDASLASALLCEVTDQLTAEDQDHQQTEFFYDLLQEALMMLGEGKRTDIVTAVFLANVLEHNGMGPAVDACVLCEKPEAYSISPEDGGFLCRDCAEKAGVRLYSIQELRQFRLINKASLAHYDILADRIEDAGEDIELLVRFFTLHGGIDLRSYELYKRIRIVEPQGVK